MLNNPLGPSRESASLLAAYLEKAEAETILAIAMREAFPGRIALVSSFGIEAAV